MKTVSDRSARLHADWSVPHNLYSQQPSRSTDADYGMSISADLNKLAAGAASAAGITRRRHHQGAGHGQG